MREETIKEPSTTKMMESIVAYKIKPCCASVQPTRLKPVSHLWLIPCSFHNEVKYGFSLKVFQNDAAQVREYLCQIVANIFHIQLASRTHAYKCKCKCKHRDICTG